VCVCVCASIYCQFHDYVNEQPVTIWTELRGNLQVNLLQYEL